MKNLKDLGLAAAALAVPRTEAWRDNPVAWGTLRTRFLQFAAAEGIDVYGQIPWRGYR